MKIMAEIDAAKRGNFLMKFRYGSWSWRAKRLYSNIPTGERISQEFEISAVFSTFF